MFISEIKIENFRLLKNSTMNVVDKLCLMIGRNNSGKTSFMVLFDKFFNGGSFDYNDFSLSLREEIENINIETDVNKLSIRLFLCIKYSELDNLSVLSEFMMDLDPASNKVNIVFECSIDQDKLLDAINANLGIEKRKFIKKYLSNYLKKEIYVFDELDDIDKENRYKMSKKEISDIKRLIDFDVIHAKRNVASSEDKKSEKVLSGLTTKYFNESNSSSPDKFEDINLLMDKMDSDLDNKYSSFFFDFLKNTSEFLNLKELKIISNLKANEVLQDSSEVVYGDSNSSLPEYLNGLGYMNILYLLLTIEIKIKRFENNNRDIKLLFIEEPEAHTHPQMQYIFARKIESMFDNVVGLQTIITTHSPHIVANHPFENIRYMLNYKDNMGRNNIKIKNFYLDLKEKYKDSLEEFKFLNQYLSIESAELFFTNKAIFIEGISEKILLSYFISKFDYKRILEEKAYLQNHKDEQAKYIPISSQNITILQVGSNAKVFRHFLEFLEINTLIITDIDTTKLIENKFKACAVGDNAENTSNATLRYFFNAPEHSENDEFNIWLNTLISRSCICISENIKVSYQKLENGYHARSFEDSFINLNQALIKANIEEISGLKNKSDFNEVSDIYKLSISVIEKKSDFSASVLFLAHSKDIDWTIPSYIEEGLEWIQKM